MTGQILVSGPKTLQDADSAGYITPSVVQNLPRHGETVSENPPFFFHGYSMVIPWCFHGFPSSGSCQVLTVIFALSLVALAAGEEISGVLALRHSRFANGE